MVAQQITGHLICESLILTGVNLIALGRVIKNPWASSIEVLDKSCEA